MALYQSLAEHYQTDIVAGRLTAGTRLPALRRVAKQHEVSLTTAIKAYQHLEHGGWIIARPQSGYFVAEHQTATALPQSPYFKAHSCDPGVHSPPGGYDSQTSFTSRLGIAMLAPSLVNREALEVSIKRATRGSGEALLSYPESQGSVELRSAIAQHFQRYDLCFKPENLVITHGCLHAVRLALECVSKPGDAIAISSPCFCGLLTLLTDMSRRIVEIPLRDDGLDLAQLETLMQKQEIKAGLFSTSHMNPSGTSLAAAQKQTLAALAAKYRVPIIEDDVYLELGYQKKPPLPAKHWDQEGWVLWCGSVSKTLAPGLRIGWCLPGRFLQEFIYAHQHTSYGVNTLMQLSLADFIRSGEYSKHLAKLRPQLQQQTRQYQQKLCELLPNTARISQPQGGIVLWLQVPQLDAQRLSQEASGKNIDIRSGASFTSSHYYRDCFRLNVGWPLFIKDASAKASLDDTMIPSEAMQELVETCQLINQQLKRTQR